MKLRDLVFVVGLLGLLVSCQLKEATTEVQLFQKGNFPARLNSWGLLENTGESLIPNPASLPYDLSTPLFSDYAHKFRTIFVPAGKLAKVADNGDILLPVGSIVTKTFFYPLDTNGQLLKQRPEAEDYDEVGLNLKKVKLIETRLLVHLDDGWVGLPYVWNDAGTEANLEITGAMKPLVLVDASDQLAFNYVVPDFNQCEGCHVQDLSSGEMALIGVKTRHLEKPYRHLDTTSDQLTRMVERGWLASKPVQSLVNVNWQDTSQPIDDRARSYLDINCGHCHNPQGAADTSGLFLDRAEVKPLRLGVCKPPVAAGQGTGGRAVGIFPGDASNSILSYRMRSLNLGAMMPELGRATVHEEGVKLIETWINQLPGNCL